MGIPFIGQDQVTIFPGIIILSQFLATISAYTPNSALDKKNKKGRFEFAP